MTTAEMCPHSRSEVRGPSLRRCIRARRNVDVLQVALARGMDRARAARAAREERAAQADDRDHAEVAEEANANETAAVTEYLGLVNEREQCAVVVNVRLCISQHVFQDGIDRCFWLDDHRVFDF